jgi:hypothetical protein
MLKLSKIKLQSDSLSSLNFRKSGKSVKFFVEKNLLAIFQAVGFGSHGAFNALGRAKDC